MVRILLEFSGGVEHLFGGKKSIYTDVPVTNGDHTVSAKDVILWCRDHLISERPELFTKGDGIRPGVLVLVNDTDWELVGSLDAEIAEGDRVTFISTLHGG